jgi:hypothetical protein
MHSATCLTKRRNIDVHFFLFLSILLLLNMKVHSTNHYDTFIEVSPDSKATCGIRPPLKANRTIAERQYDLIISHPYEFTSDEIFFRIFAEKNDLLQQEIILAKELFFSKGQPCFRASPLAKTYGFGIHCDGEGRVSIYGVETEEYKKLAENKFITKLKAMRSGK